MTDTSVPNRIFPKAKDDAASAAQVKNVVPQTSDPAYRLAYQDPDVLLRDDLRPVRFQLELMNPEVLQEEAGIGSTFVITADYIRAFAKVAEDALTLNWGAISADWQAGMDRVAQHVEDAANRIKKAMQEAGDAITAAVNG